MQLRDQLCKTNLRFSTIWTFINFVCMSATDGSYDPNQSWAGAALRRFLKPFLLVKSLFSRVSNDLPPGAVLLHPCPGIARRVLPVQHPHVCGPYSTVCKQGSETLRGAAVCWGNTLLCIGIRILYIYIYIYAFLCISLYMAHPVDYY